MIMEIFVLLNTSKIYYSIFEVSSCIISLYPLLWHFTYQNTRSHFYSTSKLPLTTNNKRTRAPKRTLNNARKSYNKTDTLNSPYMRYIRYIYMGMNSQETSPLSNEEPISIADLKKKKRERKRKNETNQLKRNGRKFLLVARRAWEKFPADTRGQLKRRISPRLAMLGWNNAVA